MTSLKQAGLKQAGLRQVSETAFFCAAKP